MKIPSMLSRLVRLAFLAALPLLLGGGLRAQTVTYSFGGEHHNLEAIIITQDGLTLHAENPNGPSGIFIVDSDGIFLSADEDYGAVTGFTLRFDQNVRLESYVVGYLNPGTEGYFNLHNPTGPDSLGNPLGTVGAHYLNSPFVLVAGQTATLSSFLTEADGDPLAQILSFTVTVVPEPAAWTALAGFTALAVVATRRPRRI